MSRRKGQRALKYAFWNLKATGATKRAPIKLSTRRARQYARLLSVRPEVFLAVEVGSPEQADSFSKMLARKPLGLKRAARGGAWRYIWYNPKVVTRLSSGLWTPPTKYKGDDKPVAWMIGTARGHKSLYIAAHLDNDSPRSFKLNQARDIVRFAKTKQREHAILTKNVYLGCDTNDPTGEVGEIFERYLNAARKNARVKSGQSWASNNRWLSRKGSAKKGFSIDWLGSGRKHRRFWAFGSSNSSDHDIQVAESEFF